MALASCVFALFTGLILPFAASIAAAVKNRSAKPVLLGAACFFVFQMLLRLPILQYLLPMNAYYVLFQAANPVTHMVLLALSAGVFEEFGRYIVMRFFLKNSRFTDSVAFGIGHGAFEAALLVGINILALLVISGGNLTGYSPAVFFFAGFERLSAMAAHIGLSIMVWGSVQTGRRFVVFAAVLLHGLLDFIALYLAHAGAGPLLVEAIIAAYAAALLSCAFLYYKKIRKEKPS